MENSVTIEGIVKWEPTIWPARSEDQSDVASVALEHTHPGEKTSVFQVKQFDNGEGSLAGMIRDGEVAQGSSLKVTGWMREARWKDKKTDEWISRVEITATKVEVGAAVAAAPDAADDDIPF